MVYSYIAIVDMEKKYELTLLVRPDVSEDDAKMAMQVLKDLIVINDGSILYAEYWGLRQLAYKINKNESAHYYMVQFSGNKEIKGLLEEKLKNSDIFIRYLFISIDNEEVGFKSQNKLEGNTQNEDGVVFDKRFFSIVNSVFNIK